MRKSILLILIMLFFFQGNAFCQSQMKIDQQILEKPKIESVNHPEKLQFDPSIMENTVHRLSGNGQKNQEHLMSASSEIVFSNNPSDFNMFKNTKWLFKYNVQSNFEQTITFNNDVVLENGELYLPFVDEYGNIGVMMYILSGAKDMAISGGL